MATITLNAANLRAVVQLTPVEFDVVNSDLVSFSTHVNAYIANAVRDKRQAERERIREALKDATDSQQTQIKTILGIT